MASVRWPNPDAHRLVAATSLTPLPPGPHFFPTSSLVSTVAVLCVGLYVSFSSMQVHAEIKEQIKEQNAAIKEQIAAIKEQTAAIKEQTAALRAQSAALREQSAARRAQGAALRAQGAAVMVQGQHPGLIPEQLPIGLCAPSAGD